LRRDVGERRLLGHEGIVRAGWNCANGVMALGVVRLAGSRVARRQKYPLIPWARRIQMEPYKGGGDCT
jgi:hypothetical protein